VEGHVARGRYVCRGRALLTMLPCEQLSRQHDLTPLPGPRSDVSGVVNRFDRMEWAGAFGDLGTFLPFVVAYIAVVKVPPAGILFAFGLAMILSGWYYRTPFPVQPMKGIGAIATTQAARTAAMTPAAIYAADLVTGLIWLFLGLTGWARHIARLVPRMVVGGIIL